MTKDKIIIKNQTLVKTARLKWFHRSFFWMSRYRNSPPEGSKNQVNRKVKMWGHNKVNFPNRYKLQKKKKEKEKDRYKYNYY